MILYLQSNYRKNYYSISVKNNYKNEVFNWDYEEIDRVSKKITFKSLCDYLLKKYNCKKLIIEL